MGGCLVHTMHSTGNANVKLPVEPIFDGATVHQYDHIHLLNVCSCMHVACTLRKLKRSRMEIACSLRAAFKFHATCMPIQASACKKHGRIHLGFVARQSELPTRWWIPNAQRHIHRAVPAQQQRTVESFRIQIPISEVYKHTGVLYRLSKRGHLRRARPSP